MTAQRRRTLIGVNAGIFLGHLGNFIWFPILVAALGGTESGFWAGLVVSMLYVGRLLATFSYEGVTARTGIRGAVFAGSALEAVSLLGMGFADGVAAYCALAFFIGFGSGTAFPGLKNVLISYPEDERPKAFSTFQMAAQVGLFGGALIGGLLAGFDLRAIFTIVFVIFVGFCLSASAFIPKHGFEPSTGEPAAAPTTEHRAPLFSLKVFQGIEVRGATAYFVLSAVFWFLEMSFVVGIPLHMQHFVPDLVPSAPFWVTGLTLLVLQYPLFKLLIKHLRPGAVMAVGLAGMVIAFLAFGIGQTTVWILAGCFVVVLGEILFAPSFDMWVARKVPEDRLAKAMGAMHFFRSAGNFTGALLAGLMFDLAMAADAPGAQWLFIAAVAAVCALICIFSREQPVPAAQEPEAAPVAAGAK